MITEQELKSQCTPDIIKKECDKESKNGNKKI